MPKTPSWLPYLGPPLAGLGAGLAGSVLNAGFWGSLLAALALGFLPIVLYRLWRWRHHRAG